MFHPQRKSARLLGGRTPRHISRRGTDVGRAGTARAVAHFGALGYVGASALMRPRAHTFNSREDMRVAFAGSKQNGRLLVRHDRKAQLDTGRDAGWIAGLASGSGDVRHPPGDRFLTRGGVGGNL